MRTTHLNIAAIYTITCIVSGKVYVGQTINVRKRWESHRHYLARGTHRNHHLQRSWAKHGAGSFNFEVCAIPLPSLPVAVALNELEMTVLGQTINAYNLDEVRAPRMRVSAETRAKLSVQRKALWADPEFKIRMQEAQRKAHAARTPEARSARAAAISETKRTPEALQKRSEQSKALWADEGHRAAQKAKREANWQDPAYQAKMANRRKRGKAKSAP